MYKNNLYQAETGGALISIRKDSQYVGFFFFFKKGGLVEPNLNIRYISCLLFGSSIYLILSYFHLSNKSVR